MKWSIFVSLMFCMACQPTHPELQRDESGATRSGVGEVDELQALVASNVRDRNVVAVIDHARLAQKAGVSMPPSVVTIFSDPVVNTALMKLEPRLGLDLPHKILTYVEPGSDVASVAFADVTYLKKRHGLSDAAPWADYQRTLDAALSDVSSDLQIPVAAEDLVQDYGVVELVSAYAFDESIRRLREAVLAQGDTVWFGEVDYRSDAAALGVEIPAATLLLFGGPAPGGKAMAEFPRLGLDAFCQKLLVYEAQDGSVRVLFNDIVAFAQLHYGRSNRPQSIINQRLQRTFQDAILSAEAGKP